MELNEIKCLRDMLQTDEFDSYEGESRDHDYLYHGKTEFDHDDNIQVMQDFLSNVVRGQVPEEITDKIEEELDKLRLRHEVNGTLYEVVLNLADYIEA